MHQLRGGVDPMGHTFPSLDWWARIPGTTFESGDTTTGTASQPMPGVPNQVGKPENLSK